MNRADPSPELYTIDGAVPAEALQARVEWLRRNPLHPGRLIVGTCERKSLSRTEAAALFGIKCADLTEVLEERSPVTPELALRIEAAGWSNAAIWMRSQCDYDLAQARRRLERTGEIPAARAAVAAQRQTGTMEPAVTVATTHFASE